MGQLRPVLPTISSCFSTAPWSHCWRIWVILPSAPNRTKCVCRAWVSNRTKQCKHAVTTYNRKVRGAVREEVVVELGEVATTAGNEFDSGEDLDGDAVSALNNVDDLLLLLVDLAAKGSQVLDDLGGTDEAGVGGDVVESGIIGKLRSARGSEELLVDGRHLDARIGGVVSVVEEEGEVRARRNGGV